MAKLNVEVLDMVNGEITKVAYSGAGYMLTKGGEASIGDLVLITDDTWVDSAKGAFYKTEKLRGEKYPVIIDDIGEFDSNLYDGSYEVFRKISAEPSPTLEERVTDLETEVASLKGEKASETIEFEGVKYRKVEREAREGDVVIFRKNRSVSVNNDKPYLVQQVQIKKSGTTALGVLGSCGCRVYSDIYNRTRETVDVYEPIEQAKYTPQVGDIVVVTKPGTHSFNVDDTVKVYADVERGRNPYRGQYADKSTPSANYLCDFEVRKATPAEVEAYEKAAHKASFAVGDYVKVTNDFCDKVVSVGDICEIVHDDGSNLPFKLKRLTDGKVSGYMYAHGLVKATDAEIAQATAPKLKVGDFVKITSGTPSIIEGEIYEVLRDDENELHIIDNDGDSRWFPLALGRAKYEIADAETAKWAKIGRKVNEFKKGDIIEYGRKQPQELYVVSHVENGKVHFYDDSYGCKTEQMPADSAMIRLIAPVESLFKN